ncbi:hypothetical protein bas62_0060 [Escherichia phage JohannJBalmer]|nr:hypothetical protein bas61_0060 [Escherichia phage EmilieFrey]QXV81406.1 hypothetical protein bas62_0060 [Escherichia phage JohannJBalmer]QXV83797.1 hypothetical protein bas60_0062 [Escherichia phage PaulScherrer]
MVYFKEKYIMNIKIYKLSGSMIAVQYDNEDRYVLLQDAWLDDPNVFTVLRELRSVYTYSSKDGFDSSTMELVKEENV